MKQQSNPGPERASLVQVVHGQLSREDTRDSLAAACQAANRDKALEREIRDWQSFEDGMPSRDETSAKVEGGSYDVY